MEDEQELDTPGYKDTGVKRCFILALLENVQENYENVAKIWSILELGTLSAVMTGIMIYLLLYSLKKTIIIYRLFIIGDLKIINIITGVMNNSSTFPCAFCTVNKKDLGDKLGTLRSIASIKENSALWRESGGIKSNAKDYFNCVNAPLFHGDDETPILDLCPPPSVHLLLGIVNTVYNAIAECHPDIAQSCAAASNATRHEQFGFTGRHCHSLSAKRAILENGESSLKKYATVVNEIQEMVDACFGVHLKADNRKRISDFCMVWRFAQLPTTPKFHTVHQYVAEFCSRKHAGLGKFSEQTRISPKMGKL